MIAKWEKNNYNNLDKQCIGRNIMKKTLLFLCFTILIGMSACQEPGQGNQIGEPTPLNTSTPKPTATPDVWVPQEAPAIRNSISEEEKIARQQTILDKETDVIALVFACDDVTHGGWGVLGMTVKSKKGGKTSCNPRT